MLEKSQLVSIPITAFNEAIPYNGTGNSTHYQKVKDPATKTINIVLKPEKMITAIHSRLGLDEKQNVYNVNGILNNSGFIWTDNVNFYMTYDIFVLFQHVYKYCFNPSVVTKPEKPIMYTQKVEFLKKKEKTTIEAPQTIPIVQQMQQPKKDQNPVQNTVPVVVPAKMVDLNNLESV